MSAAATAQARPPDGTVLAFDFGEKRIGVAVGETSIESARALTLIDAADNASRFRAIGELVAEWQPVVLVVGLPLHPDGRPHEITRLARRFAQRLEGRFRLPVALVDERYTSASAASALREEGLRGERLAQALDAAAAAEILRAYHAQRRAGGARM
jgi:putative Holliday junction resolvase